MTEFSSVWVSSEEQLRRLADAYTQASLLRKSVGNFRLPPGTAHFRGLLMPWMRVAVIYVAEGHLTITNSTLRFRAVQPRVFGWQVREVDSTLTFELTPTDIQTVEPSPFPSPVARLFDLPLTRVRTTRPGLAGDFLICVGGRVRIPRIRCPQPRAPCDAGVLPPRGAHCAIHLTSADAESSRQQARTLTGRSREACLQLRTFLVSLPPSARRTCAKPRRRAAERQLLVQDRPLPLEQRDHRDDSRPVRRE